MKVIFIYIISVSLSLFMFSTFFVGTVYADCADELEDLVGYTIVDDKTISGWYDDDENDDSFNGCSHGRVIIFTDGTKLTCAEYGYMYAYRPTAIIFVKQISLGGNNFYDIKMMVEDEIYDMRR